MKIAGGVGSRLLVAIAASLGSAVSALAQDAKPALHDSKPATESKPESDASPSALDAIVAPDAKPVAIVTGRKFCEGPVWDEAGNRLLFSDIPSNTVYAWASPNPPALVEAAPVEVLKPSAFSNGLIISKGMLVLAQHAGKVSRMPLGGKPEELKMLADKFEGKSLSSPNDLVMKSDGSIYFTDPPYGVGKSLGPGDRKKELDFSGIYRIAPDGTLSLLDKSMPTPNGLAFSPDEKTLYVSDTSTGDMRSFAVKADGSLDAPKIFARLRITNDKGEERSAGGDGVKIDTQGRVYCAARGGVWVFSPTGEKLGVIALPSSPTNLCFGGPDMKTQFATTSTTVYALPLKVAGRR